MTLEYPLQPTDAFSDRRRIQPFEDAVDLVEAAENFAEPILHALLERIDATIQCIESSVDRGEPPVDRGELATQELDELLMLASGHGPSRLPHLGGQFKCLQSWTSGDYFVATWSGTSMPGTPFTDRPRTVTKSASSPSAWGEKNRTTSPS